MAYATISDLIDAFDEVEVLQLADRDDDGTADADVIALVQERSQSLIDGYLRARYALPLSAPFPAIILGIDCDLQRYFLAITPHRIGLRTPMMRPCRCSKTLRLASCFCP